MPDSLKPLRKHYAVYQRNGHVILECDVCEARWSLKRKGPRAPIAVGNVLHLLNHAYSHIQKVQNED